MDKLFTSFRSLLNKVYSFYKRRNIFLKFVFFVFILLYILPQVFIFILNNTRYKLPNENGFSLVGRKAIVRQNDSLELYIYVDRKECEENKVNNKDINTFNYTYLKIGKINCVRVELVTKMKERDVRDVADRTLFFPTAIMPDGTAIYLKEEDNDGKWKVMSYKDGATKTVKEYNIFDLAKFGQDYKEKKTSLTKEVQDSTGVIYGENFKVINENTIGFIDAMVSEVDSDKPVEIVIRERQLNLLTGEETKRERERESLSIKEFNERYSTDKNLEIKWFMYGINKNPITVIKNIYEYGGIIQSDYGINKIYMNSGKTEIQRVDTVKRFYDETRFNFYLDFPFIGFRERAIYINKENSSKLLFARAYDNINLINKSQNEDMIYVNKRLDLIKSYIDYSTYDYYAIRVDDFRSALLLSKGAIINFK